MRKFIKINFSFFFFFFLLIYIYICLTESQVVEFFFVFFFLGWRGFPCWNAGLELDRKTDKESTLFKIW